jgi:CDP-diacylglycerol--glycerol-3-phosphate 3-phosphatidyltransferase
VTELLTSPAVAWGPLIAVLVLFLGALAIFAVRTARFGLTTTPRGEKLGESPVLGRFFVEYGLWLFRPVVNTLVRVGVHPDHISWASWWLHALAALALANGLFAIAGWVLLFGAICDSLDGGVARARGLSSDAGEVLDAVIDRWAEMVMFFGYAWYYRLDPFGFAVSLGACAGAVMVSYTRAKGETVGIDAAMGLMQRHERATYCIVATIFSTLIEHWFPSGTPPRHWLVLVALTLICLLANWTGIVRTRFIRRGLQAR